jgi:thioredoxin 1
VLVDFSASWCTPCRFLGVVLEEVATRWEGRLRVLKLDVDENPEAPSRLGVQTLPALLLFVGGAPVVRHLGSADLEKVETLLRERLGA